MKHDEKKTVSTPTDKSVGVFCTRTESCFPGLKVTKRSTAKTADLICWEIIPRALQLIILEFCNH